MPGVASSPNRILRATLCAGLIAMAALPLPARAGSTQAAAQAVQVVVDVALRQSHPAAPLAGLNITSLRHNGVSNDNAPEKAADPPVLTSANAHQIGKLLKDAGFRDFEIDKDGDLVVKMEGYKVLLLVGTNKNSWLLFKFAFSGTHVKLNALNEWNRHVKYSRAYLSKEGDVILESDQDLAGGVTPERINSFIKSFDLLLVDFIKFIKRQRDD